MVAILCLVQRDEGDQFMATTSFLYHTLGLVGY